MIEEYFQNKFKKATLLMVVPGVINLCGTFYCFILKGREEFVGYLTGTFLSIVFSLAWIWMIKRVSFSNTMVLFALSLGSFPIKIVIFSIFAFGGLFIFQMNQFYFGIAFLLGTVFSLFIEVWFIVSINKMMIKYKSESK